MKDKNGEKVYARMLLLEQTGGGWGTKGYFLSYQIYFLKQTYEFDGHGWQYNEHGEESRFAWCCPKNSLVIKKSPYGFKKAFKKGLCHFDVQCTEKEYQNQKTDKDYKEIIDSSDWKERV